VNPEHAVHFFGMSGIGGRHGAESLQGGVTLDNLLEMWQATPGIIPGGRDVTGKVIHAKDRRSTMFEMGLRFIELSASGHAA